MWFSRAKEGGVLPIRAIQARVECPPELLRQLWRTHVVFNERLPKLISILFRMHRGECGQTDEERDLYRRICQFIVASSSRHATYLLNSVSIQGWKSNSASKMRARILSPDGKDIEIAGRSWADKAAELSAKGKLLYDKRALLGDLPDALREMVAHESVAIISGHQKLLALWESKHQEWLRRKQDWEQEPDHRLYLAVRPQFERFERAVDERGERWPKYLEWLRVNPDLAAWRGGQPGVQEIPAAAQARVRWASPRMARTLEAEEFWKANPELGALDKLHGYYEREFVRRRKAKQHADGFDHRPTFTLPDPIRHPRWLVFNAPQTAPQGYCNLSLPRAAGEMGSIELRLFDGPQVDGVFPTAWITFRFKCDPRLADFRPITVHRTVQTGMQKGREVESESFLFFDRHLALERPAKIAGAKLMFSRVKMDRNGQLRSADAHLVFTCDIEPLPITERAKAVKWIASGREDKKMATPAGLISCAVTLGIPHIGFATVAMKNEDELAVLRSRNIWIAHEEMKGRHPGRWSNGPDLGHISAHKHELFRLRKERENLCGARNITSNFRSISRIWRLTGSKRRHERS